MGFLGNVLGGIGKGIEATFGGASGGKGLDGAAAKVEYGPDGQPKPTAAMKRGGKVKARGCGCAERGHTRAK